MRKNKLKLDDFQVKSFITKLDKSLEITVKGGATFSPCTREETEAGFCPEKMVADPQTFNICL